MIAPIWQKGTTALLPFYLAGASRLAEPPYRDDPRQPGGGMFFAEDSGSGKYEEVTYRFVKTNVGDVFWVEALVKPGPMHK